MDPQEAPEDTRQRLSELVALVQRSLNASTTPHISAVSLSSMSELPSEDTAVDGGSITAHLKPPFTYDKSAVAAAHRAVLLSGGGQLFAVIVRAERPDGNGDWLLKTRLVTRQEHAELEQARVAIDVEVETRLRDEFGKGDWTKLGFGRDLPNQAPRVLREVQGRSDPLPATPELLALFERTERLYRNVGLNLMIADWKLSPTGFEFQEYFE